jgi:hypothetical protein
MQEKVDPEAPNPPAVTPAPPQVVHSISNSVI